VNAAICLYRHRYRCHWITDVFALGLRARNIEE
jgi:hypothetical protein